MTIDLYCPRCRRHFPASPETPAGEVLDRVAEQGPWSALGDGETFEDSIVAALTAQGANCCPRCGELVTVSQESLGRLTMELLTSW